MGMSCSPFRSKKINCNKRRKTPLVEAILDTRQNFLRLFDVGKTVKAPLLTKNLFLSEMAGLSKSSPPFNVSLADFSSTSDTQHLIGELPKISLKGDEFREQTSEQKEKGNQRASFRFIMLSDSSRDCPQKPPKNSVVLKEGFLKTWIGKESTDASLWKKLFFILTNQSISYFQDQSVCLLFLSFPLQSHEPIGTLSVNAETSLLRDIDEIQERLGDTPFVFAIERLRLFIEMH